jgi:prepilin-type N-terminal cleavage/methylation domain-containing protein
MMKRAFTLIELLIVIAIIAILAAIAVPNFLESQTRAKVSRVMADMRTIATAIEAYTVDYNRPPMDALQMIFEWNLDGLWAVRSLLNQLTSPVAYLTSIPKDPFFKGGDEVYFNRPEYYTASGDGILQDETDPTTWFYGPRSKYAWVLISRGPDTYAQRYAGVTTFLPEYNGAGWVLYYDATNGTRSAGDIYYYGPGGGFNPPPVTSR